MTMEHPYHSLTDQQLARCLDEIRGYGETTKDDKKFTVSWKIYAPHTVKVILEEAALRLAGKS